MHENFLDTAETILRFKTFRDVTVRRMVITMIPTLAHYDTQTFTEHFLHKAMGHLLAQLEKNTDKALGKLDPIYTSYNYQSSCSLHCHRAHRLIRR